MFASTAKRLRLDGAGTLQSEHRTLPGGASAATAATRLCVIRRQADEGARRPRAARPTLLARLHGAPDRLLHALRRRRARAALQRRPMPAAVLVVCHGNICRSPFGAARLARELALAGVRVQSAGFIGPNRPCPSGAMTAASRRGVDLSAHRSRLLTANTVSAADLIIVMDPTQARAVCQRFGRLPGDVLVLGDLDPSPIATRAIRDPVDQDVEVFDESYERIERCVAELVRVLRLKPA